MQVLSGNLLWRTFWAAICLWTKGSSLGVLLQREVPWNEKHPSFEILLIKKIQIQAQMLMTRFWTHEDSEENWQIYYCETEIEVTVIASKNLAIYNSTSYVSLTMTWFQGKEICAYYSTLFSFTSSENTCVKNRMVRLSTM